MALVKIVQDFQAVEGWVVGEVVEITNPETLLREGKVILAEVEALVKNPKVDAAVEDAVVTASQVAVGYSVPQVTEPAPQTILTAEASAVENSIPSK